MTAHDISNPGLDAPNTNTGREGPIPLLDRLPDSVRASLTSEQVAALAGYASPAGTHPVDVRVTIPLPGRPVFFSLLAGPERRSRQRRSIERQRHPLRTIGNVIFLGSSLVGFYVLGLIAFLAAGSILQF